MNKNTENAILFTLVLIAIIAAVYLDRTGNWVELGTCMDAWCK